MSSDFVGRVSERAVVARKPINWTNKAAMYGIQGFHDMRNALMGVARISPSKIAAAIRKKTEALQTINISFFKGEKRLL
jgi:hypothetical protein